MYWLINDEKDDSIKANDKLPDGERAQSLALPRCKKGSILGARCRSFWPESPPKTHSEKTYGDSDTRSLASISPDRVSVAAAVQSEISVVFSDSYTHR